MFLYPFKSTQYFQQINYLSSQTSSNIRQSQTLRKGFDSMQEVR